MIAIIDYNAGNTQSVINALGRLGVEPILTSDPEIINKASKVILPGVGHAATAMKELLERNLVEVTKSIKVPFLGVCLGMQLMMQHSEEGDTTCLGLIEGSIKKFISTEHKVPKMGWNNVKINENNTLFKNIPQDSYFYFVHSYYLPNNNYEIGSSDYIQQYTVAINKDNFYGVQFHPEKSGSVGSQLLKNFIDL